MLCTVVFCASLLVSWSVKYPPIIQLPTLQIGSVVDVDTQGWRNNLAQSVWLCFLRQSAPKKAAAPAKPSKRDGGDAAEAPAPKARRVVASGRKNK